jgi:hypothetical protein
MNDTTVRLAVLEGGLQDVFRRCCPWFPMPVIRELPPPDPHPTVFSTLQPSHRSGNVGCGAGRLKSTEPLAQQKHILNDICTRTGRITVGVENASWRVGRGGCGQAVRSRTDRDDMKTRKE